ncbi:MAG: FAD-dependent oxidoreductase [Acidobacteriota bacterium]|nr:FAD-dependent oxidoreductase [Acidobacteriota bacterium]MDH3786458.1 FAD-dependent oxidoreductase [Acidobacteriota bacterium]
MPVVGTSERPLRVAIIGSGPAGFFTAQALQKQKDRPGLRVRVDMIERLHTPFGLVRHGVAPDHQKIKAVTAAYEKIAAHEDFRFLGGIHFGEDVGLDDLKAAYHQIVFCCGAETDRRLGVEGEDLTGSHPATEFVAWFNGHPDYHAHRFDLSCERAVVVGVGNVAVDVARILLRDPDELARTDIADHALAALRESRIREVVLLGRRGPAQAAFTNPEAKELGQLAGVCTSTREDEMALDSATLESLGPEGPDKTLARKLVILESFVGNSPSAGERSLALRFLVSPTRLTGDGEGRVNGVDLVHNTLLLKSGRLSARPTDRTSHLETGLVFRSVGYRGIPLTGVPFRDDWGIIPNVKGRVVEQVDGPVCPGLYVAGWIKRGPSGVIGTNKPDAVETVQAMLADLDADTLHSPAGEQDDALLGHLSSRDVRPTSYRDWRRLDAEELRRGEAGGRPRVKFVSDTEIREFLESD